MKRLLCVVCAALSVLCLAACHREVEPTEATLYYCTVKVVADEKVLNSEVVICQTVSYTPGADNQKPSFIAPLPEGATFVRVTRSLHGGDEIELDFADGTALATSRYVIFESGDITGTTDPARAGDFVYTVYFHYDE